MTDRLLTLSLGLSKPRPKNAHLAAITDVKRMPWSELCAFLSVPKVTEDKTAAGWYCPVDFSDNHRDSEHFIARHALTLDYDAVTGEDIAKIQAAFAGYEYLIYTTASHMPEKPRVRIVMPLSRPCGADEFCAVSRAVAAEAGIELAARESHVPAQMMFMPTRKTHAKFRTAINTGAWIDVDATLASYADWTKQDQWPRRKEHDSTYKPGELPQPPDEKSGIVGDFCRAFDIPTVIERFELPYERTQTEGRYTYTAGSTPEGAVVYDQGRKLHSHHDTDPAHGQTNAFDLVRCHRFGKEDQLEHRLLPIGERPSFHSMVQFALEQPEVRAAQADLEFDILPALSPEEEARAEAIRSRARLVGRAEPTYTGDPRPADIAPGQTANADSGAARGEQGLSKRVRFRVVPADEFATDVPLRWLIKTVLPEAELAVLYGEPAAGKSFMALDIAAAVSRGVVWRDRIVKKGKVVYVCAEGAGGFRQRLRAYARHYGCHLTELPGIVADAPNLLEVEDTKGLIEQIEAAGGGQLVIIDTLARAMPAGNENSGEDVGRVIAHCKAIHKRTGALVLIVHHSGKDATKGARGWSGLKGAVDAELEVTRNGDFRLLTVRKMKDGDDDKQWGFKLNTITLGVDDDGDDVTSCVIEHVESTQPSTGKRYAPTGEVPRMIVRRICELLAGGSIDRDKVLAAIIPDMPKPDSKRDTRGQRIVEIFATMKAAGDVFIQQDSKGGELWSLSSANVVMPNAFDPTEEQGEAT